MLTSSGDGTAHVWKATALADSASYPGLRIHSSEESAESSDDGGENPGEIVLRGYVVSTPLVVLSGLH